MVTGLVEVGVGLAAMAATAGIGFVALRLLLHGIARGIKSAP